MASRTFFAAPLVALAFAGCGGSSDRSGDTFPADKARSSGSVFAQAFIERHQTFDRDLVDAEFQKAAAGLSGKSCREAAAGAHDVIAARDADAAANLVADDTSVCR